MSAGISVLLAKVGLDFHTWGLRVLATKMKQAGMEVVYLENVTPQEIVEAAIQEDVDVIGLSSHTGAHRHLVPEVMELLRQRGAQDILVILGGVIPREDVPAMERAGVARVFGLRTPTQEVIDFITRAVTPRKARPGEH